VYSTSVHSTHQYTIQGVHPSGSKTSTLDACTPITIHVAPSGLSMNINEEYVNIIFLHDATAPSGPGPPHCRGFAVTRRHATLAMTLLDQRSA